jgi:enoyl-CoA hydratase/carnithine racemase
VSEVVLIDVQDGVAVLTLNRPDRLNAWTGEMQVRYLDLLTQCAADEGVRAIVVTGAGRGFCAGADMQNLQAIASHDASDGNGGTGGTGGAGASISQHDSRPMTFPLTIPKPIIAAINGACAGLGLVQALLCDLRIAAEGAKLTTAFARRGLVAEHGISWILPRLVGQARALDLLLSGRVVLGSEAAALGLVNRAVPNGHALDEAVAYARMLATESSPASMATMKRQVYADYSRDLDEALAEANRLMGESFTAPDLAEGVQSFLERRPPKFAPLSGGVTVG